MNRLFLSVLFVTLCVPALVLAQAPATPAAITPAKIAWMNLEQVIFTCDEGKTKFAEVQKFVDDKNSELDNLRKDMEGLRNKLSVQGSKLNDEARADLEGQIEAKDTAMQRFQQDTQKEIEARRVRVTNYIGKRMQQVVEKLAKEKGLSAVLFFSSSRDAWVDPSLNISEDVVKSYNVMFPVSAAKAPAAAAPAKKE
jgi:outer membrane protein